MKKALSFVLMMLLLTAAFTTFSVNSAADDEGYTLVNGVLTLTADVEKGFNLSAKIDKYPWKDQRAEITKVVAADGVTTIGKFAFYGCENLKDVELGKDVVAINQYAFAACTSLETITFAAPLQTAGEGIIKDSTLTKVTLMNQSQRDFTGAVLGAQKYNVKANGGEETGFDTCEYVELGTVVHMVPQPVQIRLVPYYGGLENWGDPRRTQFIVGINTADGSDSSEIRKDIQAKLKSGYAKLAVCIKDETDGKYYYIPEYFFDFGSEFYNVGEFMRIVVSGYAVTITTGHTFTITFRVYDAEYDDTLYIGKSDDGEFDTENLKGETPIVWGEDILMDQYGLEELHQAETLTENPIPVDIGPVTALTLERILIYENGMENWGDPAQTQILFCPVPWDGTVYKKNFAVTINMKANDGSSDDTFTLKVTSNYDAGSWGICRVQPCVDNTWVPVKDKEYTATISFDDRTGNVLSAIIENELEVEEDQPAEYETAVYKLTVDPVVPEVVDPTPTEPPASTIYAVSPFSKGMENWTGSPNKTDKYPEVTQILFCPDPWDNNFFKASVGKEVTVTMEAEGQETATFTLPIATVYAGGSWGMIRVEPCLMETPWVPEKDVAYTATLTFETPEGETVTVVSDGTYTLTVDPVVPEKQWFVNNGTLTVRANYSYSSASSYPWNSNKNEITKLIVDNGVTAIGAHAFDGYEKLEEIWLPRTLTSLGDYCFANCPKLARIRFEAPMQLFGEGVVYGSTAVSSIVLESQSINEFKVYASLKTKNLKINGGVLTGFDTASFATVYTYGKWEGIDALTEAGARMKNLDMNKSGTLNVSDVTALLDLLAGTDISWTGLTCDLTGDGDLTVADVTALLDVLADECTHVLQLTAARAPTCSQEGYPEHYACPICGVALSAYEPIATTSHTVVIDPAVPATCKDTGLTVGSHCSVCGQVMVAQQIVPVTDDHTVVIDQAVAATCRDTGLTMGSHCSVCGRVLIAQQIVPVTDDHTVVIDPAVEADCTHDGLSIGSHCSYCGKVLIPQTVTEPNWGGHNFVNGVCTKCGATNATAIRFSIEDASGRAGENVTVNLLVSDNPDIAGYSISVLYDDTKLEVVSARIRLGTFGTTNNQTPGVLHILATDSGINPLKGNGICAEIVFKIKNGVLPCEIVLTPCLYDNSDTVYRSGADVGDYPEYPAEFEAGTLTVVAR